MADYLGLIEKPKADRNDLAIAHISGSLKAMAKDLKTPVISLSQLSRDVEKRPNKRPTNADLRDSGSIGTGRRLNHHALIGKRYMMRTVAPRHLLKSS